MPTAGCYTALQGLIPLAGLGAYRAKKCYW
jgi:hypothetical protein